MYKNTVPMINVDNDSVKSEKGWIWQLEIYVTCKNTVQMINVDNDGVKSKKGWIWSSRNIFYI